MTEIAYLEKNRNSAFELMRIICMFLIILGHCTLATAENTEPYLGIMDNIGWLIKSFTVCSVNCFFLLTGYFADSRKFRLGNVIYMWLKTVFYSAVIYLIISGITGVFKGKTFIGYCLPVFCKKYWYMQTYLVAALLMPYLSSILERLDRKKHTFLLGILIVFFSFHQTFNKVFVTLDTTQGYGIIWCLVLYAIGSWIRRYGGVIIKKMHIMLWALTYIFISIAIFLSNYLIVRFDIAQGVDSRGNFYAYNSLTVFLQGVCFFCFFIRLSEKMPYVKAVNILAKNTLAGYLISSHPLLIYSLWTCIFELTKFRDRLVIYIISALSLTAFVLCICILIDKIIERIFYKIGIKRMLHRVDGVVMF